MVVDVVVIGRDVGGAAPVVTDDGTAAIVAEVVAEQGVVVAVAVVLVTDPEATPAEAVAVVPEALDEGVVAADDGVGVDCKHTPPAFDVVVLAPAIGGVT